MNSDLFKKGLLWAGIGSIITLITYESADPGGTFILMWGTNYLWCIFNY